MGGQDSMGLTEDQVKEMIHDEVVSIVQGQILELFGSIKTSMMEFFDDRYASLSETVATVGTTTVVVVEIGLGSAFQYRDFDNMKCSVFGRFQI